MWAVAGRVAGLRGLVPGCAARSPGGFRVAWPGFAGEVELSLKPTESVPVSADLADFVPLSACLAGFVPVSAGPAGFVPLISLPRRFRSWAPRGVRAASFPWYDLLCGSTSPSEQEGQRLPRFLFFLLHVVFDRPVLPVAFRGGLFSSCRTALFRGRQTAFILQPALAGVALFCSRAFGGRPWRGGL